MSQILPTEFHKIIELFYEISIIANKIVFKNTHIYHLITSQNDKAISQNLR